MDALTTTTQTACQASSLADWREIVARFLAAEDIKPSSRGLYGRTLSRFFAWLEQSGRLPLLYSGQLNRADIVAYKDQLTADGLSPLTIGSYIVIVRKFFAALEAEKVFPNITKGVKTPRKAKGFRKAHLSPAKASALLEQSRDSLRDYAIINLMLRTGLRTIEVVRADIADITYKGDTRVLLVWGKGHDSKDNFVVLTDKAYQPIKAYLDSRKSAKPGEPLFTSDSHRNAGGRLTTRTISGLCKRGLRAIGMDSHEFTAHSLRHTTACAILQAGGQLTDAQAVLRHQSPVTTQIYTESIKEQMRLERAPEQALDAVF